MDKKPLAVGVISSRLGDEKTHLDTAVLWLPGCKCSFGGGAIRD